MKPTKDTKQILSPVQRLRKIIDEGYEIFCQQVAGGVISLENEASMQLFLSNILLQLGQVNEFAKDEHFSIRLEAVQKDAGTEKSPKNARADIWIEFEKDSETVASAAIELKCFLHKKNAAVTDARYSVYKDLQNLEKYQETHPGLLICEIVYTRNTNLLADKGLKFSIADGTIESCAVEENSSYKSIYLRHSYPVEWDMYAGDNCFVKIFPDK
ncbi:MAG: hypothetical protein K2O49_06770 [Muribaculaceae bacterium]|nr:hypothetical protein [Muribaculaceae bacterium]